MPLIRSQICGIMRPKSRTRNYTGTGSIVLQDVGGRLIVYPLFEVPNIMVTDS